MRRILTNTTALVACLSLSLPAPVLGQELGQENEAEEAELCEDGTTPPCAPVEDGAVEAEPADAEGETGADTTEEAVEPEAGAAEAPEVLEEPSDDAAAADEVDASPAPDEAVEVEEPVESEADVSVEPEADTAEASEVVDGESDGLASSDATVDAEEPVEPEAEVVVDPDGAATEDAAAEDPVTAAEADEGEQIEESATEEAEAAEDAAEVAMSAEAASADDESEAEVTEETVTEETARSSDENFASRIRDVFAGSGDDADRDVLIGTVLGGLGGFAVSQILNNREVVASSADRVVVQRADGSYQLLKDDNALLRQPGSQVRTQTFNDGSTRTVVTRPDGSQVVTIRDAELRVVHRTRITPEGQEIVLINDTGGSQTIDVSSLPQTSAADAEAISNEEALRRALQSAQRSERSYSLSQIREVRAVRSLAPAIQLDNVTFETGSAAITPDQAEDLNELGQLIARMIEENPREIFLVEGHTDAVGDAAYNLALSDRRAESVALALTEYFEVPPENLVVQGYGERYLRIDTQEPERQNRRASVRRITELLQVASAE